MTQGIPIPKKTFIGTEYKALPIASSAYLCSIEALILTKVSGSEIPTEIIERAVIDDPIPVTHPKRFDNSMIMAIITPIKLSDTEKANQPLPLYGGGIQANKTFQPIVKKCKIASIFLIS